MISKQVQGIKRCDQVEIAVLKRYDAYIYGSYAARLASLMINDVDRGMWDQPVAWNSSPENLSYPPQAPVIL